MDLTIKTKNAVIRSTGYRIYPELEVELQNIEVDSILNEDVMRDLGIDEILNFFTVDEILNTIDKKDILEYCFKNIDNGKILNILDNLEKEYEQRRNSK